MNYTELVNQAYNTKNLQDLFQLQLKSNNPNLMFEKKVTDMVEFEDENGEVQFDYTYSFLNHKDGIAYEFETDFEMARANFLNEVNGVSNV